MNRNIFLFGVLLILVVAASGCRHTRLASRPLTEEELEWSQIIRTSYRSWRPPYYAPLEESPRARACPRVSPPAVAVPAAVPAASSPVSDIKIDEDVEVELVPVESRH